MEKNKTKLLITCEVQLIHFFIFSGTVRDDTHRHGMMHIKTPEPVLLFLTFRFLWSILCLYSKKMAAQR